MEINAILGREKTDRLMLSTFYFLGKYLSIRDAAKFFILSDSLLYGGKDAWVIFDKFHAHGILPDGYIIGINEPQKGKSAFSYTSTISTDNKIYFESGQYPVNLSLYDIQGKLLAREEVAENHSFFQAPALHPGIYLMKIESQDLHTAVRLIKL